MTNPTWTTTSSSAAGWNVIFTVGGANGPFQPPSSPQDYGEDDGTAGVREPRRPGPQPPCLTAVREPDGTWYVPLAVTPGSPHSEPVAESPRR